MRTSHVHVWSRQISVQLLHNVGPWYRITSDLTRCELPYSRQHELDLKTIKRSATLYAWRYRQHDHIQNFQSDENSDHGMSDLTQEFASCGECRPLFS